MFFQYQKVGCTLFSVFTGQIMINHSQFCFREYFGLAIKHLTVGCPTFGAVQQRRQAVAHPPQFTVRRGQILRVGVKIVLRLR